MVVEASNIGVGCEEGVGYEEGMGCEEGGGCTAGDWFLSKSFTCRRKERSCALLATSLVGTRVGHTSHTCSCRALSCCSCRHSNCSIAVCFSGNTFTLLPIVERGEGEEGGEGAWTGVVCLSVNELWLLLSAVGGGWMG